MKSPVFYLKENGFGIWRDDSVLGKEILFSYPKSVVYHDSIRTLATFLIIDIGGEAKIVESYYPTIEVRYRAVSPEERRRKRKLYMKAIEEEFDNRIDKCREVMSERIRSIINHRKNWNDTIYN